MGLLRDPTAGIDTSPRDITWARRLPARRDAVEDLRLYGSARVERAAGILEDHLQPGLG
jgi:hypothetical protein